MTNTTLSTSVLLPTLPSTGWPLQLYSFYPFLVLFSLPLTFFVLKKNENKIFALSFCWLIGRLLWLSKLHTDWPLREREIDIIIIYRPVYPYDLGVISYDFWTKLRLYDFYNAITISSKLKLRFTRSASDPIFHYQFGAHSYYGKQPITPSQIVGSSTLRQD